MDAKGGKQKGKGGESTVGLLLSHVKGLFYQQVGH